MKHSSILVSESLDRVSTYFSTTPPWTAAIPAPSNVATQLKQLDDVRSVLQTHTTNQASGQNTARHQSEAIKSLRRQLRQDNLMPIRHIANAMLAEQPGVIHQFDLPSSRTNTKRLLQAARQTAQDAVPYQSVLIANGRPADFLDQLNSTITALETATTAQTTGASIRVHASTGIGQVIRQGRQAVQYLDAIMRSCFGNNPEVMAQWRQAKRIRLSTSPLAGRKAAAIPTNTTSSTSNHPMANSTTVSGSQQSVAS